MEYVIGLLLALAVFAGALAVGMARERAFSTSAMLAIATYYVLFATMAGPPSVVLEESIVAALFIAVAVIGFKRSPWLVVAALAGHGVFDAVHHQFIANPGMPPWWPGFCGTFDVVFAACLAGLLRVDRRRASHGTLPGV